MNKLTQIKLYPDEGFRGKGDLGLEGKTAEQAGGIFTNFISSAIGLMTVVAIIWFVFQFIIGAIGIISSGGDKQALESARKKITSAIIGLVIVVAAIFIVEIIGRMIGLSDVLSPLKLIGL